MIVIPDIHHKTHIAQLVMDAHPREDFVFLGDYFDDWDDDERISQETARWLKGNLDNPRYLFLWGNHDLPYAYPEISGLWCSGFSLDKQAAIGEIMRPQDWGKLRFSHSAEGYLLTHAGLTNGLTLASGEEIRTSLEAGALHRLLEAGRARGGPAPVGGITWCDYLEEFYPHSTYSKQIFGHTPLRAPDVRNGNLALDTHMKHFARLSDGTFTIHEIEHRKPSRQGEIKAKQP
jgi:hypothetical protein